MSKGGLLGYMYPRYARWAARPQRPTLKMRKAFRFDRFRKEEMRRRRGAYRTAGVTEVKFHDVVMDVAPIPTTAAITNEMLTIPQGDGQTNRDGRKIVLKSVYSLFTIILPATTTAASTGDSCNVWLVQDRQTNGTTISTDQFLTVPADFQSFNALDNGKRFRVLWKRQYSLSSPSGGSSGAGVHQFGEQELTFKVYQKLGNMPIEYDNSVSTGAIGSIRSNNLYIIFQSRVGLLQVLSRHRVRFVG